MTRKRVKKRSLSIITAESVKKQSVTAFPGSPPTYPYKDLPIEHRDVNTPEIDLSKDVYYEKK